jgi:glycerol-3-phosphate dehydrogenase
VLLLEKQAIAAGTSSRSSKLIHGGLRYLETGQLRLVRESLDERRILLRIAPDIVRLQPFHVPVYRTTRRRPWQLRAGLAGYAMLGGLGRACRFATVPRRHWDKLDGLDTRDLQTVFRYFDGQTDDAVLTRAVVDSAVRLDATIAMPARFVGASIADDGVVVRYTAQDKETECRARVLVNAAGPWAAAVAKLLSPMRSGAAVELIQGTHILLAEALQAGIYYVENPADGRAVFVMPRGTQTLVGTTETVFNGDPDEVCPHPAEIEYLLRVVRRYFARWRDLHSSAVVEAWAGLRVLPAGRAAAFKRSRETILEADDRQRPRYLSIYGGKLTTYRATAQRVLDRIRPSLPARAARADTRQLKLRPP